MNHTVISNALGGLDKPLSQARQALFEIERDIFGDPGYGEPGGFEDPRGALRYYLEEAYDTLLVVLEAAEMPETRSDMMRRWTELTKKGLSNTTDDPALYSCSSPALTLFERTISALRFSVKEDLSSLEALTLTRLEAMLRDTPNLVHRRNGMPSSEHMLQEIVHDYLSACFPDFVLNPPIAGGLKHFKPDCGIRTVRAAIEFKFVPTKDEVKIAYSGIVEDSGGYKGSRDWTRFYAVIYQAQPFVSESQFKSDLDRAGAGTWKAFVVNGPAWNAKIKKGAKKKTVKAIAAKKP